MPTSDSSTVRFEPVAAVSTGQSASATVRWKRELAECIRDPGELCTALGLDPRIAAEARTAAGGFPLLVPRGFVARMRRGDPHDPLLMQVLPRIAEGEPGEGFTADPLQERQALAGPGLVRKYAGRALLLVTGGCAVNCRYCFRREFPYAESGATREGIDAAIEALAKDSSIHEAILSGGDPLVLDDERLADLIGRLGAIAHLRRVRLHTRLPIVLPSRVTDHLVAILADTHLAVAVVVHANHPAELDGSVAAAVDRLAASRALLLNQAVLLAGVNDSVATLADLSERLLDLRILPYYLHLLDRVRGVAHFEVAEARAMMLHEGLRSALPGYAVPRLVREVPGEPAKVWLR